MKKTASGKLEPADGQALQVLKGIKTDTIVKAKITKPRNVMFHRKFFALLDLAFQNQDKYDAFEPFRKEVVMRAGWYVEHHHLTGAISYEAKSISFAKMDQIEFEELYWACIDVICKYLMPGMDRNALHSEVQEKIAGFAT